MSEEESFSLKVIAIFIAANKGDPMELLQSVKAVVGRGGEK